MLTLRQLLLGWSSRDERHIWVCSKHGKDGEMRTKSSCSYMFWEKKPNRKSPFLFISHHSTRNTLERNSNVVFHEYNVVANLNETSDFNTNSLTAVSSTWPLLQRSEPSEEISPLFISLHKEAQVVKSNHTLQCNIKYLFWNCCVAVINVALNAGEVERRLYKGVDTGERLVRFKPADADIGNIPSTINLGGSKATLRILKPEEIKELCSAWVPGSPSECNKDIKHCTDM